MTVVQFAVKQFTMYNLNSLQFVLNETISEICTVTRGGEVTLITGTGEVSQMYFPFSLSTICSRFYSFWNSCSLFLSFYKINTFGWFFYSSIWMPQGEKTSSNSRTSSIPTMERMTVCHIKGVTQPQCVITWLCGCPSREAFSSLSFDFNSSGLIFGSLWLSSLGSFPIAAAAKRWGEKMH